MCKGGDRMKRVLFVDDEGKNLDGIRRMLPNIAVEAIAHHHPTRTSHSGLDCTVAVYLADLLAHEQEAHPQASTGFALEDT
jgi:hypothetical protein